MKLDVRSVIREESPKDLPSPPKSSDHSDHMLRTALLGHPQLAADHLLNEEMAGKLVKIVGNFIRRLNLEFLKSSISPEDSDEDRRSKILVRHNAYESLIEVALNLAGVERSRAGFSDEECSEAFDRIVKTLEEWERLEMDEGNVSIAGPTVDELISNMEKVQDGKSMVANMGRKIRKDLEEGRRAASFVSAAKKAIQENVYYKMTLKEMCKFGNDYAAGLRWVRHLGYVQVSTNPTLAAKAFDDFPELWDDFKERVGEHSEWLRDPEKYKDDIGMEGTIVALLDNLRVFSPIALLSDYQHGMVSYQLNPQITGSLEDSVSDALEVYSRIREYLRVYNEYLTWGYSIPVEAGRPDVVFKVSGDSPAATEITAALCSLGIGTNDTVVYSVAQEALLITQKFKGLARAVKKGIPITQTYETNMGGRLEYHLRDILGEELFSEALEEFDEKHEVVQELARELGIEKLDPSLPLDEKVKQVTSAFKGNLRDFTLDPFVNLISKSGIRGGREETLEHLEELEDLVQKTGIYVTQRVYQLFFSPENRPKWLKYLQDEYDLSEDQAEDIIEKIDVLPASKRRPDDTYLTLAGRNMTNTEFPNHQVAVLETSREEEFDLSELEDSALSEPDPEVLDKLLEWEDFRRAYEITPELREIFEEVGIETEGLGEGGMKPDEWPEFGSVVKTMEGFTKDFLEFRDKTVAVAQEVAQGS